MFKVDCPGCKANYNVDERRIPPKKGMKMRCPKCSTTFTVHRPGEDGGAGLPAVGGTPSQVPGKPPPPAPPRAPRPAPKAPRPKTQRKPTMVGLGEGMEIPGVVGGDPALPAVRGGGGGGGGIDLDDLGLPAVGGRGGGDAALPAVGGGRGGYGADLPAVGGSRGGGADLPAVGGGGIDVDLPAVGGGGADLPAVGGGGGADLDLGLPAVGGGGGAGLPAVGGSPGDLPAVGGSAGDLPAVGGGQSAGGGSAFDELDLALSDGDLGGDMGGDFGGGPAGGFGELADPGERLSDFDLDAPSPGAPPAKPAGGGVVGGMDQLDMSAVKDSDGLGSMGASAPPPTAGMSSADLFGDFGDGPPAAGGDGDPFGKPLSLPPAPGGGGDAFGGAPPPAAGSDSGSIPGLSAAPPPAGDGFGDAGGGFGDAGDGGFGDAGDGGFGDAGGGFGDAGGGFGETDTGFGADEGGFGGEDGFGNAEGEAAGGLERQTGGGGVTFGEINLGEDDAGSADFAFDDSPIGEEGLGGNSEAPASGPGWGERDFGEAGDDDMEFGAIPQEEEGGGGGIQTDVQDPSRVGTPASARAGAGAAGGGLRISKPPVNTDAQERKSRTVKYAAAFLGMVALGGAALYFTPFGPFGYYFIYDSINEKNYESLLAKVTKDSRAAFAQDNARSAESAIRATEGVLAGENRAGGVRAYAAYLIYLKELRFGHNAAASAHAKELFAQIKPEDEGVVFSLARAAQTSATGKNITRGLALCERLVRRNASNVDALALAGEVNLRAKKFDKAIGHFNTLARLEPAPRAYYGLARAHLAKHDAGAATKAAKKALSLAPKHAGARLLLGQLTWDTTRDEKLTLKYIDEFMKDKAVLATASPQERTAAHTLIGLIHLKRSRYSAAEKAFNAALRITPKAARALTGMGESLYRAGRFAEASARFNSAIEADPEAIDAKIGAAKTQIALERLKNAKDLLHKLDASLTKAKKPDFRVVSWLGRAQEALGDKPGAEASYNRAIKLAGRDSRIISTYVALAKLLMGLGRTGDAEAKLADARKRLPETAALRKAMGETALQTGRYEEAEKEFLAALKMDDSSLELYFRLGIVQRRLRKFAAAAKAFAKVEAADKNYPGLALERAVLYEASGESAKALRLFKAALAESPDDPDLMLRVAAALLGTRDETQTKKAEELLRKVLAKRSNSAEANHYLGRALLQKGTNLAEALKYLKRATDIDKNRAEYFLYVGWAANEADDTGLASTSLERALSLDKSLAEAFWQRGILRRRQRTVADAEKDLLKALELRPSLYQAHATLAEVYEDQQKWTQARTSWEKAIKSDPKRGTWRFRLGKLLSENGNKLDALPHLEEAVNLGSAKTPPPPWLADALLRLADAEKSAGKRKEAISHYQRYLSMATRTSPYRRDAIAALKSLGATYKGDLAAIHGTGFGSAVHRKTLSAPFAVQGAFSFGRRSLGVASPSSPQARPGYAPGSPQSQAAIRRALTTNG